MKRKDIAQNILNETDSCNEPKLKERKMDHEETNITDVKKDDVNKKTSSKTEKYDRQIRLWGEDGQQDLENANICLINVTALGTEILKCLILPGIGKFTIVDTNKVTHEDLGSNFFVDANSLGKSKAQSACELIQELNPDTHGDYVCQDPIEMLSNNPQFYEQFTIVICSHMSEQNLSKLSTVLWKLNIPLVICDNFSFLGYMRIVLKEHVMINTQPDNALEDFRLDHQFVELDEYMSAIDLDGMSRMDHSHTPYLVLLYKYLQKWKQETNLDWPKTYSEKRQIRDMIREGIRKNEHGVPELEENFDEAIKNCNIAFTKTSIPVEIKDILQKAPSHFSQLDSNSINRNSKFWILVSALNEFVTRKGVLPVRGTLPDMFSDTKRFIELQNIYKKISGQDCQLLSELVHKCLQEHNLPSSTISSDEIQLFCKNAFFLRIITGLSFQDEVKPETCSRILKDVLESSMSFGSEIYLVFRVLNQFANRGHYPFKDDANNEADMQQLITLSEILLKEIGISMPVPTDFFKELLRSKMGEFHPVASLFGGVCAHEVIKIITKQFIPVDNTVVFNGMTQVTSTIKL